MTKTTTLALLALACLLAMPSLAQARYSDGMNLYEYISSNPANSVDPSGLWKIHREGNDRANAEAEQGDTVASLAGPAGFCVSEWPLVVEFESIRAEGGQKTKQELAAEDRICAGEIVTVPNVVYWSEGRPGPSLWHGGFNQQEYNKTWGQMQNTVKYWQKEGFRVIHNDDIFWTVTWKDTYGQIFIGHGWMNQGKYEGAIIQMDGTFMDAEMLWRRAHHKLAWLHLVACGTAKDKWEMAVANTGSVRLYDDKVSKPEETGVTRQGTGCK